MSATWQLRIGDADWKRLHGHMFPGDQDEHGAVLGASLVSTDRGHRLLARRLWLAEDGVDYLPGERGYRVLTAEFVRDRILDCADERLAYLAVHCHGGESSVAFSTTDLESHRRGYPALRDLNPGQVVGGIVMARAAIAGELWLPDGTQETLTTTQIVGRPMVRLYPTQQVAPTTAPPDYDRQARIFGDRGQDLLRDQKVGVIGAGGAGSQLVDMLSRVGVGHLVIIDPDRVEPSNLPRIVGSVRRDAGALPASSAWLNRRFRRHKNARGRLKVEVADRVSRQIRTDLYIDAIPGDVADEAVARSLVDCDYLFLAADSMQARLIFNALVHQYLISGTQVGAKVTTDPEHGSIREVFAVSRPITPGHGCLWCNGLINPGQLQDEAENADQLARQRYVDDPGVVAPSVITLNALATAQAANDYLFATTGLLDGAANAAFWRFLPRKADIEFDLPRSETTCLECGRASSGRYAAGDARRLPTRPVE